MFTKIFGSRNDRLLRALRVRVDAINALEPAMQQLSDTELAAQTDRFRERLTAGETLDALLHEAFAVVREAAVRTIGLRHFDVQLLGGIVLHQGRIAEMGTGEGKTLVATLPVYLNALDGNGVHVVTVNDYLAARDAKWMGAIYRFLGLTVDTIVAGKDMLDRRTAYAADITYGTNNEFGFDYLRDNMAFVPEDRVMRPLSYAIVDEVDSILIDEARTPLIISGAVDDDPSRYVKMAELATLLVPQLTDDGDGDFAVDEKNKQVLLTDTGYSHAEHWLTTHGLLTEGGSLYDAVNVALLHQLNASLRARMLFRRDVDYIVQDGQVVIVDEFTGRTMPGRRWSDGLHQAIEAKEGVQVRNENQTLASITFQNYFRLYTKLAGMTGTADTEAAEFQQIYRLEVAIIPPNKPLRRVDEQDTIFLTAAAKYNALIEDVLSAHERGQPVLVGTSSIESAEHLSNMLQRTGVEHAVLNAKQHEREAAIIAEAGRRGAITIATNMAGRGTDIVLGGAPTHDVDTHTWQQAHDEVVSLGGLYVVGAERNESRRIDNQLRGRAGRQGDPGASRFYLSLEDSLMRIFASDRVKGMMQKLGLKDGEAITHRWINRAIENAQKRVEGHNFDIRKNLLQYDDVANDQRRVIYQRRNEIMEATDIGAMVARMRTQTIADLVKRYLPVGVIESAWDTAGLARVLHTDYGIEADIRTWLDDDMLGADDVAMRLTQLLVDRYAEKVGFAGEQVARHLERVVMLQELDKLWREHLAMMDYLRRGIGLRGYAQQNPVQEFKRESFALFARMLDALPVAVIKVLSRIAVRTDAEVQQMEQMQRQRAAQLAAPEVAPAAPTPARRVGATMAAATQRPKVGRNDPCPCGSGKKFKFCHGRV